MTAKVIETGSQDKAYGMMRDYMIVEHPEHGRLLIVEGFGGDDVEGQMYRWRHGVVAQIKGSDTMETLEAGEWNEHTSLLDAVLAGVDTERPMLDWDGIMIERMVDACAKA